MSSDQDTHGYEVLREGEDPGDYSDLEFRDDDEQPYDEQPCDEEPYGDVGSPGAPRPARARRRPPAAGRRRRAGRASESGCPVCAYDGQPFVETQISAGGWVTFVVLLLFCAPICWLPFVMGGSMQERIVRCGECRSVQRPSTRFPRSG